ncbi:hypothetical protein PTI98_002069 [Pleurotus ostreatus]|nr:hypothetical protein PTI98_002069 [Pleurotus ostreatus]
MRIGSAILASFAISGVFGSPATTKTGKFIVKLRDGASSNTLLESSGGDVTHRWGTGFQGFAGTFSEKALSVLRSSPDVESISEDGIMQAFAVQTDAPWGLARARLYSSTGEHQCLGFDFLLTPMPRFRLTGAGVSYVR